LTNWVHGGFRRPESASEFVRERYHPGVVARRHVEIYEEVLGRANAVA
jgi:hypothetical protein